MKARINSATGGSRVWPAILHTMNVNEKALYANARIIAYLSLISARLSLFSTNIIRATSSKSSLTAVTFATTDEEACTRNVSSKTELGTFLTNAFFTNVTQSAT